MINTSLDLAPNIMERLNLKHSDVKDVAKIYVQKFT